MYPIDWLGIGLVLFLIWVLFKLDGGEEEPWFPDNIETPEDLYYRPKEYRVGTRSLRNLLEDNGILIDTCNICGHIGDVQIHHIIPLSCGGSNDVFNLEVLCEGHHKVREGQFKLAAQKLGFFDEVERVMKLFQIEFLKNQNNADYSHIDCSRLFDMEKALVNLVGGAFTKGEKNGFNQSQSRG